ncbi:MAG: hypothetical protein WA021_00450 [Minisyncoccia bacterium]
MSDADRISRPMSPRQYHDALIKLHPALENPIEAPVHLRFYATECRLFLRECHRLLMRDFKNMNVEGLHHLQNAYQELQIRIKNGERVTELGRKMSACFIYFKKEIPGGPQTPPEVSVEIPQQLPEALEKAPDDTRALAEFSDVAGQIRAARPDLENQLADLEKSVASLEGYKATHRSKNEWTRAERIAFVTEILRRFQNREFHQLSFEDLKPLLSKPGQRVGHNTLRQVIPAPVYAFIALYSVMPKTADVSSKSIPEIYFTCDEKEPVPIFNKSKYGNFPSEFRIYGKKFPAIELGLALQSAAKRKEKQIKRFLFSDEEIQTLFEKRGLTVDLVEKNVRTMLGNICTPEAQEILRV